jgi:hypothetical protein
MAVAKNRVYPVLPGKRNSLMEQIGIVFCRYGPVRVNHADYFPLTNITKRYLRHIHDLSRYTRHDHAKVVIMKRIQELMQEPDIPPESFFGMIDTGMTGTRAIAVIMAAIELHIFDLLKKPMTIPELALITRADSATLVTFCDTLVAMDLLRRSGTRYHDTPLASTYLDAASAFSQVHYLQKNARMIEDIWNRLPDVIRSGPVAYAAGEFFPGISLRAMADNAVCGRLQATIHAIVSLPRFPWYRRMIDLGGGHGLYAIALTQQHPGLEAYVMDLPPVIPLLQEYIMAFQADRVHAIPGNFFEDPIGRDYDIIFSSSNPSGKSIDLLPEIASSLHEGGVFINVQSDRDEHRDPLLALEWQLWTLNGDTKGADHYTKEQSFLSEEYRRALEEQGLRIMQILDIPDNYHKNTMVKMMIAEKE